MLLKQKTNSFSPSRRALNRNCPFPFRFPVEIGHRASDKAQMYPGKSQQRAFSDLKCDRVYGSGKQQGQQFRIQLLFQCFPGLAQQSDEESDEDSKADNPGVMKHAHFGVADPGASFPVFGAKLLPSKVKLEARGAIAENRMIKKIIHRRSR